jgi:hypothetical protein
VDAIREGDPPAERPADTKGHEAYFWDLLQNCWNLNPEQRPVIDDVAERLKNNINQIQMQMQMQLRYDELGIPPSVDPTYDELSPELRILIHQRPLMDLTDECRVHVDSPIAHGGFFPVYGGLWDGQNVRSH